MKKFLRGSGLMWAVLVSATAAWSLATIEARKVYSAGVVFTAADYNLDVGYWITYINQLMVKFPGDSVKTTFGSFDTLTTSTAAGVITLKDPIWSLSASDSLKMHVINARRANLDTLGVGATGATGAGVPVGFRVAFTAGIRARANLISADSVRIVDSLTVAAGSKTKFLAGSIFQAAAITPDSLLGTVFANGIFNIGTATNWKLAGTAYTGTMALINAITDGSVLTTQHYHPALSASDGTPNPAWSVDTNGDLNPAADNTYNIGTTAASVDTIIARAITEGTAGSGLTIYSKLNNSFTATFSNAATSAVGKAPGGVIINFSNQAPDDNTGYFIQAQDSFAGGTVRFKVFADGDVQNHDNSYGALSDSSLKNNIKDAPDLVASLRQVQVREYEFKDEPGEKAVGVIAQELRPIFSDLVLSSVSMGDTLLSVNYMGFMMPLIQSNQRLWGQIDSLKLRIAALENR